MKRHLKTVIFIVIALTLGLLVCFSYTHSNPGAAPVLSVASPTPDTGGLIFFKCPGEYDSLGAYLSSTTDVIGKLHEKYPNGSSENLYQYYRDEMLLKQCADIPNKNQITGDILVQLVQDGKYDNALAASGLFIAEHPDDTRGWVAKAMAYWGLKDCAKAGAAAYHVSALNPTRDFDKQLLGDILNSPECQNAPAL